MGNTLKETLTASSMLELGTKFANDKAYCNEQEDAAKRILVDNIPEYFKLQCSLESEYVFSELISLVGEWVRAKF